MLSKTLLSGNNNMIFTVPDNNFLIYFNQFQGIGDSSQGFANFFLFCLFTDKIRKKFRQCCERFIPRCSVEEKDPMLESTNLAYGARDFYA